MYVDNNMLYKFLNTNLMVFEDETFFFFKILLFEHV